jgi:hypothetical protein
MKLNVLFLLAVSVLVTSSMNAQEGGSDSNGISASQPSPIVMSYDKFFLDNRVLPIDELEKVIYTSPYATNVLVRNARFKNRAPINISIGTIGSLVGYSIWLDARRAIRDDNSVVGLVLAPANAIVGAFGLLVGLTSTAIGINGVVQMARYSKRHHKAARAYNKSLSSEPAVRDYGATLNLQPTGDGLGLVFTF